MIVELQGREAQSAVNSPEFTNTTAVNEQCVDDTCIDTFVDNYRSLSLI